LADFEKHSGEFTQLGVSLIAASVDAKGDAEKMVRELGLTFPVAYGLDALAFARTYGCFYDPGDPYLHATGFVIEPAGKIAIAVYSTGAVGRLSAADCLAFVRRMKRA